MKLRPVSSVTRECGNLSVLVANSMETIGGRNLIGQYFLPQIALHLAFIGSLNFHKSLSRGFILSVVLL